MKHQLIYFEGIELKALNGPKAAVDAKFAEIVEKEETAILLFDGKLYVKHIPEGEEERVKSFIESMVKQWHFKFTIEE